MNINLINMLCCPKCCSDLLWEITSKTNNDVQFAKISCKNCKQIFAVQDGIADFTINNTKVDLAIKEIINKSTFVNKNLEEKELNYNDPKYEFIKKEMYQLFDLFISEQDNEHYILDIASGVGFFAQYIMSKGIKNLII